MSPFKWCLPRSLFSFPSFFLQKQRKVLTFRHQVNGQLFRGLYLDPLDYLLGMMDFPFQHPQFLTHWMFV